MESSEEITESIPVEESDDLERNLNVTQVRSVYLITYCQADVEAIPTREAFVEVVLEAFRNCGHANSTVSIGLL